MNIAPPLLSWLLAVPYLLTGIGFLVVGWAAGGYALTALCNRKSAFSEPWYLNAIGGGIFLTTTRIAVGLAMISWIGAIFGVSGHFHAALIFPILLPLIVLGLPVAHRYAIRIKPLLLRDRLELGFEWIASPRVEKFFGAAIVLAISAITVNAIIGALVPDMNQDPMWYHMSVPQQWVFSGHYDVFPSVMPSAYPLAVESLYAIIFLLKTDTVLCSLLTVLCGALLFCSMAGSAAMVVPFDKTTSRFRGWGVAAILGLWAPMLLTYGLVAPVQPKNDIITMLWTFCGVMVLWLPMLSARGAPLPGWWATGGFLLGTACSAKPFVLGITFFVFIFAVPLAWRYEKQTRPGRPRETITGASLALLMMGLAAMPWMIRGIMSHGLPLFPIGNSILSPRTPYAPLFESFDRLYGFAGTSASGWAAMLTSFPGRLAQAAGTNEKGIFLYMVFAAIGLFSRHGRWRLFACMLFAQMTVLIGMHGAVEVFRFFSPNYCIAAPLVAWVVAVNAPKLGRPTRLILGGSVCLAMLSSVALQQFRVAKYKTYGWQFRPILSKADVIKYATHAEFGSLYLNFPRVAVLIDKEDRVLLLGSHYPFYLHRDTLWNDEIVKGGTADKWAKMNPAQASQFLHSEKIDDILYAFGGDKITTDTSPVPALTAQNQLLHVPLPDDLTHAGWSLYRIR